MTEEGNRERGTLNGGEEKGTSTIIHLWKKEICPYETRCSQEILRPCTNPLILIMGIPLLPVARSLFPLKAIDYEQLAIND